MTDAQITALITVLGAGLSGVGLAIRFAASRVIKSLDDSTAAMLENTKSNAVLSTKIDIVAQFVQRVTPPLGIPVISPKG